MTTIVVVRKDGFAAIAADTLTKCGYLKESATYVAQPEKIFRVGRTFIALSGAAASDLAFRDYFLKSRPRAQMNNVMQIYRVWNNLHQVLKDEYYLNPERESDDSYESLRTRALIANESGIYGVDAYRYVQEFTRFYAYGSGKQFALGSLFGQYDQALTAEQLAVNAVAAAAEFDDATGLPITSFSIKLKESR